VDLICPTAQGKHLRHIGTTGKSLEQPQILSSEEHLLELSFVGVEATPPLRSQRKFLETASTGFRFRNRRLSMTVGAESICLERSHAARFTRAVFFRMTKKPRGASQRASMQYLLIAQREREGFN
jgi:hypothetical protein